MRNTNFTNLYTTRHIRTKPPSTKAQSPELHSLRDPVIRQHGALRRRSRNSTLTITTQDPAHANQPANIATSSSPKPQTNSTSHPTKTASRASHLLSQLSAQTAARVLQRNRTRSNLSHGASITCTLSTNMKKTDTMLENTRARSWRWMPKSSELPRARTMSRWKGRD